MTALWGLDQMSIQKCQDISSEWSAYNINALKVWLDDLMITQRSSLTIGVCRVAQRKWRNMHSQAI